MWNPLDIFPKHMDPNLRLLIIFLVVVQFLAFLIWMGYLFTTYLELRRKRLEDEASGNKSGQTESNRAKLD